MTRTVSFLQWVAFWFVFFGILLVASVIGELWAPEYDPTSTTVDCVVRGVGQPWEVVGYINQCPNN